MFQEDDPQGSELAQDTKDSLFGIGELAAELGITPRAIRFYESKGLIKPRRAGANRVYDRRDRARLHIILRGKRLGFSLEEIAEYLALYDADPNQVTQIRHLLHKVDDAITKMEQKRRDVERTLRELRQVREEALSALKSRTHKDAPS